MPTSKTDMGCAGPHRRPALKGTQDIGLPTKSVQYKIWLLYFYTNKNTHTYYYEGSGIRNDPNDHRARMVSYHAEDTECVHKSKHTQHRHYHLLVYSASQAQSQASLKSHHKGWIVLDIRRKRKVLQLITSSMNKGLKQRNVRQWLVSSVVSTRLFGRPS